MLFHTERSADVPEIASASLLCRRLEHVLRGVQPYGKASRHARTNDVLERLRDHGFLRAMLSGAHGGAQLGIQEGTSEDFIRTLYLIGKADLAAGRIYEGHVNAVLLMLQHAQADQRKRWQEDVTKGHWFGVWNTDAIPAVSYTQESQQIRLEGAKHFCSGAQRVTRALITATSDQGQRQMLIVPMELVPSSRIDSSSWKPLGMQSSDSYYIDFSGITLPRTALLGEPDAYLREPWFTGGAVRFSAVQFGGIEALAQAMYAYLNERGRAQDPFQQYRAGEVAMSIESGHLWLQAAARRHDQILLTPIAGGDSSERMQRYLTYMRMTRIAIEKIAILVLQHVDRSIGANGYLEPLPFSQLHRDLTMYLRQPAPDATLTAVGRQYLS